MHGLHDQNLINIKRYKLYTIDICHVYANHIVFSIEGLKSILIV